MRFGNPDSFAIEIEILETIDDLPFGLFFFWINGERLGNPLDDKVYLRGCINWLRDLYEKARDRCENALYNMELTAAVTELNKPISENESFESSYGGQFGDLYNRFYISHIGMTSFDHLNIALIENEEGLERCIWWSAEQLPNECFLPPNEIEERARNVVDWYESLLQT